MGWKAGYCRPACAKVFVCKTVIKETVLHRDPLAVREVLSAPVVPKPNLHDDGYVTCTTGGGTSTNGGGACYYALGAASGHP